MSRHGDEEVLDYPLPNPTALEPPAVWPELRERCPVAHIRLPSGDGASLLTRYEDVRDVLSDPRFTRMLHAPDAARIGTDEEGGVFNRPTPLPQSGEGHVRWRRMLSRWFTAKRMTALRPEIEAMTDRLVDEMVAGGHPADLNAAVGFPLPVWVICKLLGVPESDRDRFAYWSDTFLNLTRYGKEETEAAQREFVSYMQAHVEAVRADPKDDLLSELLTATDAEGGRLTEEQLVATGQALLIAGHETTANMIGKMAGMLLADRERWERLLADRSLVRSAVEEALRFDANPGLGMPRYIAEESEVGGTVVPAGTTVMCSMAAANRDEKAFEGADEMRLDRSPNPHLAFGAGAHSCLGQSLARTELQAVLDVLLRRLPTLRLAVPAEELRRVEGLAVGGLREVPVRW
ncbi:cytochrome P450 [Streptomyces sp. NPDC059740]|uniref:cytochrome P450 n=1 Tax=Streptomyces sp. NPDC059740 TaxID=3346926 RepID=UPI00365F4422